MRLATILNAIGSQPWAAFLVLVGAALVVSGKGGLAATTLGSTIAGCGVNMFQSSLKSQTPGSATDHPIQPGV